MPPPPQTWTHPSPTSSSYTISTDQTLLDVDALLEAFASPMMWWAKPWEDREAFVEMLRGSMCFGVYHQDGKTSRMIGFARLITDYHTFSFLTDLYILPLHRGHGLARWLMTIIDGVMLSWPMARRMLFVADKEVARGFYGRLDGMREVDVERGGHTYMERMYKGFPEEHV